MSEFERNTRELLFDKLADIGGKILQYEARIELLKEKKDHILHSIKVYDNSTNFEESE